MNSTPAKIYYIDNLRILLTVLVILHHTFITYGAPGGWYFTQKSTMEIPLIVMTLFVATNQAFFMGFFFFLAAYFTPASLDKKGIPAFVRDRLIRLGLPLLFYTFILGPVMNFMVYKFGHDGPATFAQFLSGYDDWIDFGVLWFTAALLVFTLLYTFLKSVSPSIATRKLSLPSNNVILLIAVITGIISFLVRIVFPVGWVLRPVGFQLAHFTQYIALFIAGLYAFRNQWLSAIDYHRSKRWFVLAIVLVFVIFPAMFAVKAATHSSLEAFQGKGSLESFLASVWEQLTGISIIIALIGFSKAKWNFTPPFLLRLSRASYATYIFHPIVIIGLSLLVKSWPIEPVLKLLLVAPLAVILSFFLGTAISKMPLIKKVV